MKLIHKSAFSLVCSLSIFTQTGLVTAQTLPVNQTRNISNTIVNQTLIISQKFQPRVDNKPNPKSAGGASRGTLSLSCLTKSAKEEFIIVTPTAQEALTISKKPTFFWNIPTTSAKTMTFQIVDKGDNIYEKTLNVPQKPGIFSFTLPKNAPELELNKSYNWYVVINCNDDDTNTNPWVVSAIQRIEPDSSLGRSLQKSKPRNLSNIYAEAGIWQDGLQAIIQQRCSEPNNLVVKMKWRQFLESVGLNQLVNKPLINSCNNNGK